MKSQKILPTLTRGTRKQLNQERISVIVKDALLFHFGDRSKKNCFISRLFVDVVCQKMAMNEIDDSCYFRDSKKDKKKKKREK